MANRMFQQFILKLRILASEVFETLCILKTSSLANYSNNNIRKLKESNCHEFLGKVSLISILRQLIQKKKNSASTLKSQELLTNSPGSLLVSMKNPISQETPLSRAQTH